MTDTFTFNGFEPANTTAVPDVLFDVLLSMLSGAEIKVMLYIIRRTLGFKKSTDAISLTQFEKGITTQEGKVLDKGCGLNRETICKALKTLEEKGCIKATKRNARKRDKDVTLYSIRFVGEPVTLVGKSDHVPSRKSEPANLVGKSDHGSRKNSTKVVGKSDLQDTVIQVTELQDTERENPAQTTPATIASSDASPSLFSSSQVVVVAETKETNQPQEKPAIPPTTQTPLLVAPLTEPDMTGAWSAEKAVQYAEWCNKKRLPDAQRSKQVESMRKLHREDAECTLLQFKLAYDNWYTWWQEKGKGPLHASDLMVKQPNGFYRYRSALDRLESRKVLQMPTTKTPGVRASVLVSEEQRAKNIARMMESANAAKRIQAQA